jgi:hypothetical protein
MRNLKKDAKIAVYVLVAALLLAQALRIEKSNPPVRSDISANPPIKQLLHRACYNCHSNETVWPWYSNVAPVSWLVGNDVKEARKRFNFSDWETYAGNLRIHKLTGIAEEMESGGMPPWYYALMHPDARLNQAERSIIQKWTADELELLKSK